MRVAYFNDTVDCYHWGCTATSGTIKEWLAEHGYHVDSFAHRVLATMQLPPDKWEDYEQAAENYISQHPHVFDAIRQSDLVLINGEGTLHLLNHGPKVLLYIAYLSKKYFGKKVQLINHSCFPNDHEVLPDSPESTLYRHVYTCFDYVAVREHKSLAILQRLGIAATLAFDNMPLYVKRHYTIGNVQKEKNLIVATSSRIQYDGLPAIVAYLKAMRAQGFNIIVLSGAAADPAEDELYFADRLLAVFPKARHVVAKSVREWLSELEKATLLVSGRFHYTIAAGLVGTPAVVFDANTPKNKAICEDMALPAPLSYLAQDLENELHRRTISVMFSPPNRNYLQQVWGERALRNFDQLPAVC
jgi:polysaccharide pyruvyl transferase WcaK-like protein